MAISEQKMLQTLYDSLFAAFTNPPPNAERQGPDGQSVKSESVYLVLNWPGQQIDTKQFARPWSPDRPDGSMASLENFARFVDPGPKLHPIYAPTGNTVSQVYSDVVNAHVSPPPETEADKKNYQEAWSFLNVMKESEDDEGNPVKIAADSPAYARYKRAFAAYDAAVATLAGNYFTYDMSKPEDQRKWAFLGPPLQDKVTTAYDDLMNAQASKVRDKIAVLAQSSKNQVGRLFREAAEQYQNMRRASVQAPGERYMPAYAFPANWASEEAAAEWTDMTVASGSLKTSESSDFRDITAGAEARWGLWSGGGEFAMHDAKSQMSKETSDLKVSFKYARVQIVRPWLNFLLFGVDGWSTSSYPKAGQLSDGTKTQKDSAFPLLPTSFIAVRDLAITAKWGKEDSEKIEHSLNTKAHFGWGPFQVSGGYAQGSKKSNFASEWDGTTLTNNGLQVIGWVNTVVPRCPPKNFA